MNNQLTTCWYAPGKRKQEPADRVDILSALLFGQDVQDYAELLTMLK